jgi:hypothetical protein
MTNPSHLIESLGKITTTIGVPVSIVANLAAAKQDMHAHWILCQALPGNTKDIHLGYVGMVPATGVDCIAILSPGETRSIPPNATGLNRFQPQEFYIDVEVNGEGALVSAFVA